MNAVKIRLEDLLNDEKMEEDGWLEYSRLDVDQLIKDFKYQLNRLGFELHTAKEGGLIGKCWFKILKLPA